MFSTLTFTLALSTLVVAIPVPRADALDAATLLKNGQTAQALNARYATLSLNDSCINEETACIQSNLATCVNGAWKPTLCRASQKCLAVPSLSAGGANGTITGCTSEKNALSAIEATGAQGGLAVAAKVDTAASGDKMKAAGGDDEETCDPDTEDNDNDDDNEDTCDTDSEPSSSTSSAGSKGATSSPSKGNSNSNSNDQEKTVTVTAQPKATTTVFVTRASSSSPSTPTNLPPLSATTTFTVSSETTIVSPEQAASIISAAKANGDGVKTVGAPAASASSSAPAKKVIQLSEAAVPAPTAAAGNNNAAAGGAAAANKGEGGKPVLTLAPAAPATAATPASNANADAKPGFVFAFGDA